jgi:hypothetical protein
MRAVDWGSPEIAAIGRKWMADKDLASELSDYGADASQLLLPYNEQDMSRPRTLALPTAMVDAIQCLMIALGQANAPRLDESADAFLKRIGVSS